MSQKAIEILEGTINKLKSMTPEEVQSRSKEKGIDTKSFSESEVINFAKYVWYTKTLISSNGGLSNFFSEWKEIDCNYIPGQITDVQNGESTTTLDRNSKTINCENWGDPEQIPIPDGSKRPPLGLKPKWLYDEERMVDVVEAINRYLSEEKDVPEQWMSEYRELVQSKNLTFHYIQSKPFVAKKKEEIKEVSKHNNYIRIESILEAYKRDSLNKGDAVQAIINM